MRVLDLFSGIGGFSLGLERAGMRTVAFCEIDPYCRAVLGKHWPGVKIHEDVRNLSGADVGAVDVICGGFPCQDISVAGAGAGLDGERSGLWIEYARLIGELRPRYIIVENVAALTFRGLLRVLGDLTKIGYDAEWRCIPAASVGAPHSRDRVWIVAYPQRSGLSRRVLCGESLRQPTRTASAKFGNRVIRCGLCWVDGLKNLLLGDGIPTRMVRPAVKAFGNAVVPQIPEIIGRAIMSAEKQS